LAIEHHLLCNGGAVDIEMNRSGGPRDGAAVSGASGDALKTMSTSGGTVTIQETTVTRLGFGIAAPYDVPPANAPSLQWIEDCGFIMRRYSVV
jgi:hypothetical protein